MSLTTLTLHPLTMEIIFEIIFQFLAELVLQILFEVLGEIGLQSLAEPFRRKPNPWLGALGYACFGAVAGGLSLWLFPGLFIHSHSAQIANLLLTPILAGGAMAAIGQWRSHQGQDLIRLDRFACGYLFALSMALVRFHFGQ